VLARVASISALASPGGNIHHRRVNHRSDTNLTRPRDCRPAAGQEPVEPAIDEQGVAEQLASQARNKDSSWSAWTVCSVSWTKQLLEIALGQFRRRRPNKMINDQIRSTVY
jgi:hypothetical protein